ncbi:3',5'-cyclic AMP phosphodiesterase CpdA [Naumannella cuiyingiana]|uniref:3',5'-cyclic AMP phosphodiesterase CpdA n=1 Tax=Naumannella cuiyingiana TaxID=1347891 RepID=A0A7Z0IL90_9ACTN|nr:3',5'-cyclic AMP phosphodiesterase CpdA [Naumannella cuiyingiana]
MSTTILQVSDPHLGASGGPERAELGRRHWAAFAERVSADPPALVVVSGDIVVDDPDDEADQAEAATAVASLGVPTLVLPGNHDVGDHQLRRGLPADWHGKLVTAERVAAWEARWGPSFRSLQLGSWTIIGINAQVLGSGTPREAEQWDWLERTALAAGDPRPKLVFLHESLGPRPEDTGNDSWLSVPTAPGHRLAALIRDANVALVAAGHTHKYLAWSGDGIAQVTAPSLAGPILVRPDMTAASGDPDAGWLDHTLHDDGTVRSVRRLV